MIEIPGFIDLHTHTRYPDADKFPYNDIDCLLYTSPSPRDNLPSRMPSSA